MKTTYKELAKSCKPITKGIMRQVAIMYFEEGKSLLNIAAELNLTQGNVAYCIEEMQYEYEPITVIKHPMDAVEYKMTDIRSMFEQGYSVEEIAKKYNADVKLINNFLMDASRHRLAHVKTSFNDNQEVIMEPDLVQAM